MKESVYVVTTDYEGEATEIVLACLKIETALVELRKLLVDLYKYHSRGNAEENWNFKKFYEQVNVYENKKAGIKQYNFEYDYISVERIDFVI